jgi:hypothetical protein
MKYKNLVLCSAFAILLFHKSLAQVPSYVPTNGLVGWWPFNGNANDESGNGNNGTVNGATLAADRFGTAAKAYSFNGSTNFISIPHKANQQMGQATWNVWVKINSASTGLGTYIFGKRDNAQHHITFNEYLGNGNASIGWAANQAKGVGGNNLVGSWHMLTITYNQNPAINSMSYYFDGVFIGAASIQPFPFNNGDIRFGIEVNNSYWQPFKGLIDDASIHNRILSQQEITNLFKSCADSFKSQPTSQTSGKSSTCNFSLTYSGNGYIYQWQSNPNGFGWQNVPNTNQYSGATTQSLSISNLALNNHKQQFRAIVSNGPCKDTSKVVEIIITDTCINTKSVSVADTLKFAVNLTGVAPPNNRNTMKVYPNPTNSAVVIDNGNYTTMANYIVKIENSIGQQVFFSKVNQQQFVVDVSTLGGKGIYTLSVLDPTGKLLETKKIVLQ